MPTGDPFFRIRSKAILGRTQLKDLFLDYLRDYVIDVTKLTWSTSGLFEQVVLTSSAADTFTASPVNFEATDGDGHFLKASSFVPWIGIPFENALGIGYDVGATFAESAGTPVAANPRTGKPEYTRTEEILGNLGSPDSVSDLGGGSIELVVDSVTEAGVDNSGRIVRVLLTTPETVDDAVAVQDLTVTFSGGSNRITATGSLGQSTISTTAGDYVVILLGPIVKRNSSLVGAAGVAFIGEVTGAGAGNTPTGFDITQQTVFIDFPTISAGVQDEQQLSDHFFTESVISGGVVTDGGGLTVDVTAGEVVTSGAPKNVAASTGLVIVNGTNFIYVDSTVVPPVYAAKTGASLPDADDVLIAEVIASGGSVQPPIIDLRFFSADLDKTINLTVGSGAVAGEIHFDKLSEALLFVDRIQPFHKREYKIQVIGPVTETTADTPLLLPNGIVIEGANRGADAQINWSGNEFLFDLNGATDFIIRDLLLNYTGAGGGSVGAFAFGNSASAGTATAGLVEGVRLDGNDNAHGFLFLSTTSDPIAGVTFRDCSVSGVTDFGVIMRSTTPASIIQNAFLHCSFVQSGTAQLATTDRFAFELGRSTGQPERIRIQDCRFIGFDKGVESWGTDCWFSKNHIENIDKDGIVLISTAANRTVVEGNILDRVSADAGVPFVGIEVRGTDNLIFGNDIRLDPGGVGITAISFLGGSADDNLHGPNNVNGHGIADTSANLNNIPLASAEIRTDGEVLIPILAGLPGGGGASYTKGATLAGQTTVTRNVNAQDDAFIVEIPVPNRGDTNRGIRPTGFKANAQITSALAVDVRFELIRHTKAADTVSHPGAVATLFGDIDADYDAAHDTAAERRAVADHTFTVADNGIPAFLTADQTLRLRWFNDDNGGGAGAIILKDITLLYDYLYAEIADR